jgi:hypothetical protein
VAEGAQRTVELEGPGAVVGDELNRSVRSFGGACYQHCADDPARRARLAGQVDDDHQRNQQLQPLQRLFDRGWTIIRVGDREQGQGDHHQRGGDDSPGSDVQLVAADAAGEPGQRE